MRPDSAEAHGARPRNGFGVTALGVLALIFGIVALRRVKRNAATNKVVSIAGIVTGAVGLVLQQAHGDQAKVRHCDQQYVQQINSKTGR